MTDDPVSRNEFEDLRRRLDDIDRGGTRGVAIVGVQVQGLATEIAKVDTKIEQHLANHRSNTRWFITTAIAMIAAIAGLYPLIYTAVHVR